MQSEKPFITERNDSRFDIKTHLTLDDDDLPDPSVLKCLLSIPGANYNISQEVVYYPGKLRRKKSRSLCDFESN